jgi:hypothetical protein
LVARVVERGSFWASTELIASKNVATPTVGKKLHLLQLRCIKPSSSELVR